MECKMKNIMFNLFLFVAVPIVTGFAFYVMFIGKRDIAIIGKRTGLPAVWDKSAIKKYWHNVPKLKQFETETEKFC